MVERMPRGLEKGFEGVAEASGRDLQTPKTTIVNVDSGKEPESSSEPMMILSAQELDTIIRDVVAKVTQGAKALVGDDPPSGGKEKEMVARHDVGHQRSEWIRALSELGHYHSRTLGFFSAVEPKGETWREEARYKLDKDASGKEAEESENARLRREIEELRRETGKFPFKKAKLAGFGRTPFFDEILSDPLPMNFKPLNYEYDGTSDPSEHMLRFENGALLHQYSEGVKCRVFLTTLAKSPQQWFWQLPPQSIFSFDTFKSLFLHQFASARRQVKTSLFLMSLKQGPNENLRSFIGRFNAGAS